MALEISKRVLDLGKEAQAALATQFSHIDEIAEFNTRKILGAFHKHKVSEHYFYGTTGYGYNDEGRDKLDEIYAEIFNTQDALVRVGFVNGTHAIGSALFGVLRPGDVLLSAIGAPYDTLLSVIGETGHGNGSLRDYGVEYRQVPLTPGNKPDLDAIVEAVKDSRIKAVLIQRSRGYATRASLSVAEIKEICTRIREVNSEVIILVDNCYGEFVETMEPSEVGADLLMGSLIKNPGGGLAPSGGYIAGRHELVERTAMRMTVPGIGRKCGATLGYNRELYQGLFMAPHTVSQALKTATFAAKLVELLGYQTDPTSDSVRHDIVQMIHLGSAEKVQQFCKGIQAGAPVDSYVTPIPWDMPGYDCPVVMAAGSFIQGASIELTADAPIRPPYTVYMQGGLTYESGKIGILLAIEEMLRESHQ
jgi:cystathionine beta-lyase family protein involved in aluminum resistance